MIGLGTPRQRWTTGLLLCGVLGGSAYASAQPTSVSRYEYSTTVTSSSNASHDVSLELDSARENLASARAALDVRQYERARRLAERAWADARMAEVQADTESLRQIARDVRVSSEAVRDEALRAAAYLPPLSPLELRTAREQLESARIALNLREYERARRLAEQAGADARYAEVRAGTESLRQIARDVRLSSEAVRDEAVRAARAAAYLPPLSPLELRTAREQLESARIALNLREYERAYRLAGQAREDARLAELRAGTEGTRQVARDVRWNSEAVRDEAARLAALY